MNQELLDELFERFEPLAEKIGQGAAFLWEVSYRQAIVIGVLNLVIAFAFIGAAYVIFMQAQKSNEMLHRMNRENEEAKEEAARKKAHDRADRTSENAADYEMIYQRIYDREYNQYMSLSYSYDRAHDSSKILTAEYVSMAYMAGTAATAIISLWPLYVGLTRIVNPGFYAINQMIKAVGL
jgi:hypothetical protein